MRTAEAIIKERYPFYDQVVYGKDVELCGEQVSKLINEARIEAIKECSEKASIQFHNYDKQGNKRNIRGMGYEINIDGSPESDYITVSKQSILKLIEQVK